MPEAEEIPSVLVAESQPVTRYGLVRLLEAEHRFSVLGETGNGREIETLCNRLHPSMVVLGLPFPELSAVKIIQGVRSVAPDARIIVLGTHADGDLVELLTRSGIDALLSKKLPLERILHAVGVVARGKTCFIPDGLTASVVPARIRRKAGAGFRKLTHREREVFLLIAQTMDTREIAHQLNISGKTVENHRRHIMRKLGVKRSAELVRYAAVLSMVA